MESEGWHRQLYETRAWADFAEASPGWTREAGIQVLGLVYDQIAWPCVMALIAGGEAPSVERVAGMVTEAVAEAGLGDLEPDVAEVLAAEVVHNARLGAGVGIMAEQPPLDEQDG